MCTEAVGARHCRAHLIVGKEVVGDEPLQLLSNPACRVHDVAVALSHGPNLLQVQPILVVPAACCRVK